MKKLTALISLIVWLVFPSITLAHTLGQQSYFKVNDKFTTLYPVQSASYIPNLTFPQDGSVENYLVNQPIKFELVTKLLPFSPDVIPKGNLSWDFGDGTSGQGLINTHTYSKIGSYIVAITFNFKSDNGTVPQLIQSTLINVLPEANYVLPQAIITINSIPGQAKPGGNLTADLSKPLNFNADKSTSSTPLASYYWYFGDGQTSTEASPNHLYNKLQSTQQIFLRVINSDGFISDNFLNLNDAASSHNYLIFVGVGLVLLVLGTGLVILKRKSR